MKVKGRIWVSLWLLFGLATLGWVGARRTAAHIEASKLNELRTRRSVLEAERAELIRRIREGESRAVLTRKAAALGLRLPADTEIAILQAPAPQGN